MAASEAGGKVYPLEDTPELSAAPDAAPPSRDFREDLRDLQTAFPGVTEMPAEVMRAYMGGQSLREAYAAHRMKTDAATIAGLNAKIAALEQAAAARAAAPVRGTAADAPGGEKRKSAFERGFDSDTW